MQLEDLYLISCQVAVPSIIPYTMVLVVRCLIIDEDETSSCDARIRPQLQETYSDSSS